MRIYGMTKWAISARLARKINIFLYVFLVVLAPISLVVDVEGWLNHSAQRHVNGDEGSYKDVIMSLIESPLYFPEFLFTLLVLFLVVFQYRYCWIFVSIHMLCLSLYIFSSSILYGAALISYLFVFQVKLMLAMSDHPWSFFSGSCVVSLLFAFNALFIAPKMRF